MSYPLSPHSELALNPRREQKEKEVRMRMSLLCKALLTAGLLSSVSLAQASNLVYCSEGSPGGFDPGQYLSLIHI